MKKYRINWETVVNNIIFLALIFMMVLCLTLLPKLIMLYSNLSSISYTGQGYTNVMLYVSELRELRIHIIILTLWILGSAYYIIKKVISAMNSLLNK